MSIFKKITSNESPDVPEQIDPEANTHELLTNCLQELGCHFEQDGDVFNAIYQGENMLILSVKDSRLALIRDLWWHSVSTDDLTALSLMRRAINTCNMNDRATLFYTIDEENHTMGIHSQMEIVFTKEIPELTSLLRFAFDNLLHSHLSFYKTIEDLRQEEYSKNNT